MAEHIKQLVVITDAGQPEQAEVFTAQNTQERRSRRQRACVLRQIVTEAKKREAITAKHIPQRRAQP